MLSNSRLLVAAARSNCHQARKLTVVSNCRQVSQPLRQSNFSTGRTHFADANSFPRTIASLLYPNTPEPAEPTESLESSSEDNVTINGWVRSVRRMKSVSFAHISDGSSTVPLQAVLTKEQAAGLSTGTSVQVTGTWKSSLSHSGQRSELVAEVVKVLGDVDPETYPLQKKYQTAEYLRTMPHLRARLPANAAVLQLRSHISSTLTQYFNENEVVQVYPPIITSSDCEGAGEVFAVSTPSKETSKDMFFKTPKYLTVSTQLHLEALAAALPRVWTLSPTFRAEKSDTNRHLSEFYMLEAEISFIETLDPLLEFIENMIRTLVQSLSASRIGQELLSLPGHETEPLELRWEGLTTPSRWKRMTYTEAVDFLQTAVTEKKIKFKYPTVWGSSLQSEHEKYLAGHFNGPVFVTDYPASIKPFYMLPSTSDLSNPAGPTVACFDLLLPSVGELIGGSLREHRHAELLESMKTHGLIDASADAESNESTLDWYMDLRKMGSVPHGGFGLGMERLVCYLSGLDNIREASAFPRWVGRCDC